MRPLFHVASRLLAAGLGAAAAGYAVHAGATWLRYGRPATPRPGEADSQLDRFMPQYDVVERHHIEVNAPPDVTLAAAIERSLDDSRIVRAIFRAREIVMGVTGSAKPVAGGLLSQTLALGWGILADVPGREVVVGAVTKPWEARPVFRAVADDKFLAFNEPDCVKIVWTLRADPIGDRRSIFRTETRAVATDAGARAKFRPYWALASPGIWLIRQLVLRPVKRDAERAKRD
jgi:hypothetical protein